MRIWVKDAHAGGTKPKPAELEQAQKEITDCWKAEFKDVIRRVLIRFKSQFCYIDADVGEKAPMQLCRLRHFRPDHWSVDLFNYSSETYEPAYLPSGEDDGKAVEGFRLAASFLKENGP